LSNKQRPSNVVKSLDGRGSAPDPAGEGYSAPPDPLAGGERAGCSLPKIPIPLSALAASNLVAEVFSCPLSSNPEYVPAKPLELSVFKLFMFTVVIMGNLA